MDVTTKKFIAELGGTIVLCSVVLLSLAGVYVIPTPVLIGCLIGMLMYPIGHVAGLHINPAVTLGLLSIGKISTQLAAVYIAAQLLGAGIAWYVVSFIAGHAPALVIEQSLGVWIAEILGTMLLCTGISSVAFGKIHENMFGIVLGTSVFLGVSLAVLIDSHGGLNPAVALALGLVNPTYLIAPILGAILGFNFYRLVMV